MSKRYMYFLYIMFFTTIMFTLVKASGSSKISIQDENISVIIEINGRNIVDAQSESNAIEISDEEVKIFLQWNNTCSSDLTLSSMDIELTYLDLKVYTLTYNLTITTPAYTSSHYTFYQDLKPYLKQVGVNLIEGVYKLIFRLTYQTSGESNSTHKLSMPFFIRIKGNLLTSAIGVATTAGTIATGITAIGAMREVSSTVEVAKIINSVAGQKGVAQLGSMPKGLTVVKTTDVPKETLKRTFESAKSHFEGRKCPQCHVKWPRKVTVCGKCGITFEQASELFGNMVVKLSAKAQAPISKTATGVGLKVLERFLGVDTAVVHAVLKTMVDVGTAKARVSPRFIIKRLVTNGLKVAVTTIVFLQISGLKVFGMSYLILAIVLGAAIPFTVGFAVEKTLKI